MDNREEYSTKSFDNSRFISRRPRHCGSGVPLALSNTFPVSSLTGLTRGKRSKFIKSISCSALTTNCYPCPHHVTTKARAEIGASVVSQEKSHSQIGDEYEPKIELACACVKLGMQLDYSRSKHSMPVHSSFLRNYETINIDQRTANCRCKPKVFPHSTMGSLLKDAQPEMKKKDEKCNVINSLEDQLSRKEFSSTGISNSEELRSPVLVSSKPWSCGNGDNSDSYADIRKRLEGQVSHENPVNSNLKLNDWTSRSQRSDKQLFDDYPKLSRRPLEAFTSEVHIGQARATKEHELKPQMSSPCLTMTTATFRRQISKRKGLSCEILLPQSLEQQDDEDDGDNNNEDDTFDSFSGSYGTRNNPCTPTSPKMRRVENNDPYQIFEVQHSPCLILTVKVLQGRDITMGFQDYYDTPDPYITLVMKSSPDGRKATTVKENNQNPVWNETFTFFINFTQANVLEISLMESNSLWFDQKAGTVFFDLVHIHEMDKPQIETFVFNEVSWVDIELKLEFDRNPTLRYSLCLCPQEKNFMEKRKERILDAMRKLLGDENGPQSINELPTIAVIGSGGGFRAMTGFCGVFKALVESGILACTMYAGGLSGSSWLLSTLYSHPKWPNLDMDEFSDELKLSTDKSLMRFLNVSTMYSFVKLMIEKRREGQPVSFTDIFGRMVGETLLTGRIDATLTDQRGKLNDATVPMPLYTCVHVKKDVPAKSFQEWVEFSPYEIGMPKYGTFMDAELFGSKFFMGKLVKQYKEQPLHFLQGVWGSAFCILFKRLLEDNHHIDPTEMVRQEMGDHLDEEGHESSSDCSEDEFNDFSTDSSDSLDSEAEISRDFVKNKRDDEDLSIINPSCLFQGYEHKLNDGKDTEMPEVVKNNDFNAGQVNCEITDDVNREVNVNLNNETDCEMIAKEDCSDDKSSCDGEKEDNLENDKDGNTMKFEKEGSVEMEMDQQLQQASNSSSNQNSHSASDEVEAVQQPSTPSVSRLEQFNQLSGNGLDQLSDHKKSVNWGECSNFEKKVDLKERRQAYISAKSIRKSRSGSKSYWKQFLQGMFESNSWELLSTRRGRAAVIHNFMRGLSLQQSYPLSPFTPVEERVQAGDEFDGIFEMHPTSVKHIYMVDAGLTFNSPYPLILRPQRAVDIILSFDFSARPSDNHPPFKELLLAEKWARLNRIPFPPIDVSVFDRDGMKELYIFRHPTDPHCPVVFHFPLINKKFKYYKKPEIPRETKEEFDFAEFDVFDDPRAPYSTFNFTYTHNDFERLSQLMEFNTLLHISDIKEVITDVIKKKREGPPRHLIQSRDIKMLHMNSIKHAHRLRHFISRMESKSSFHSPSMSFCTPSANGELSTNPFFAGFHRKYQRSISEHTNTLKVPRRRRPESFHNTISRCPVDLFSNYSQLNSVEKKDFPKAVSFTINSPAQEKSVYSTPPDSAIHFHQPEEILAVDSVDSCMTQIPMIDNLNQSDQQKSKPHSANADNDQNVNLCQESISSESRATNANENYVKNVDDFTGVQNTSKRPFLLQKLKLPGTLEFTPSETIDHSPSSSDYNTLSTETDFCQDSVSTSEVNVKNSGSGVLFPVATITENHDPNNCANDIEEKQKLKTQPPNPFFAKAFFMRSPHNASFTSNPCLVSSDAGDIDRSLKITSEISDQSKCQNLQSSNSTENKINSNFVEIFDNQSSQQDSVVCSSTYRPSQDEAQPPSTQATPEIFTLAPVAFRTDGTPVFDHQEAKMFYESVKDKRKLFCRQSTISSFKNITLGECQPFCEDIHGHNELESSSNKQNITHSKTHSTDFSRTSTEGENPGNGHQKQNGVHQHLNSTS